VARTENERVNRKGTGYEKLFCLPGPAESSSVNAELKYLAWVTVLTALIRVPWMLNKVAVRGISKASGYPRDSEPLSPWAHRLWVAHEDAVDNLIVFAVLVGLLHTTGQSTSVTVLASAVYFWARLVHVLVYAFAIPWVKTAAHVTGFGAILVLAWEVLALTL
jgi:uncharacterized MAPEG superfamily protein